MRNFNSVMNKIVSIGIYGWPVLGFKRGMNSYDYNFSKDKLSRQKYSEPHESPLYLDKVGWGFLGVSFYILPVFCFIAVYKEIYRLEVNIRHLEDEKKSRFYNELL